jgi:hypothetical protein
LLKIQMSTPLLPFTVPKINPLPSFWEPFSVYSWSILYLHIFERPLTFYIFCLLFPFSHLFWPHFCISLFQICPPFPPSIVFSRYFREMGLGGGGSYSWILVEIAVSNSFYRVELGWEFWANQQQAIRGEKACLGRSPCGQTRSVQWGHRTELKTDTDSHFCMLFESKQIFNSVQWGCQHVQRRRVERENGHTRDPFLLWGYCFLQKYTLSLKMVTMWEVLP